MLVNESQSAEIGEILTRKYFQETLLHYNKNSNLSVAMLTKAVSQGTGSVMGEFLPSLLSQLKDQKCHTAKQHRKCPKRGKKKAAPRTLPLGKNMAVSLRAFYWPRCVLQGTFRRQPVDPMRKASPPPPFDQEDKKGRTSQGPSTLHLPMERPFPFQQTKWKWKLKPHPVYPSHTEAVTPSPSMAVSQTAGQTTGPSMQVPREGRGCGYLPLQQKRSVLLMLLKSQDTQGRSILRGKSWACSLPSSNEMCEGSLSRASPARLVRPRREASPHNGWDGPRLHKVDSWLLLSRAPQGLGPSGGAESPCSSHSRAGAGQHSYSLISDQ